MTPADLARRLFRDQCNIGPNSSLEAYGETAAVAAMVPLIEALEQLESRGTAVIEALDRYNRENGTYLGGSPFFKLGVALFDARAALTPQPEEVA